MLSRQEPPAYPFEPGDGLELHPRYAELLGRPLSRVRLADGSQAWLAVRHADVKAVLSDPRFGLAEAKGWAEERSEGAPPGNGGLMSLDPPEHTRLRSLVGGAFGARRVERLRSRAQEVAEELLDRIVESKQPSVDLMERFAIPLPTTVNCELLGVPDEYGRFWSWVEATLFGASTAEQLRRAAAEFASRTAALVALRRDTPGDDLLGSLLQACDRDGRITEKELSALVGDLLVAGFVTVARQIAVSLYHLIGRPDMLSRLRAHPEQIPRAAEELLRYVQLIESTLPRRAGEDVRLGGVLVRAGDIVVPAPAAANRDPAVFPEADRLDLARNDGAHLGFGHGAHYCLGAHVARLELQVALETALRRLPGLRLAVPPAELRWTTEGIAAGLRELPVTFDRRVGGVGRR
ncbi:cytochrome P450 [Embleya sp. NPDC059259]|uniref:cytochrome P450 n=1 Tax=unclassified Embleya TaxID=2699296 RepID=UPI0036BB88B9